jgi:hypothetical protein
MPIPRHSAAGSALRGRCSLPGRLRGENPDDLPRAGPRPHRGKTKPAQNRVPGAEDVAKLSQGTNGKGRPECRITKSGAAIQMSNRRDFAHYEGITEGNHSAARSRIWPDDGSGRAGGGSLRSMPRRTPPAVDCCRVEAWRHSYPNQTAGSQAVAIILAARISLRVDDA